MDMKITMAVAALGAVACTAAGAADIYVSLETATMNANSLNAFRQAVGLPQQGTIVSKVDMFGNRYPLDAALKLFGAMKGKGAQAL